jgi:hypothetical protein
MIEEPVAETYSVLHFDASIWDPARSGHTALPFSRHSRSPYIEGSQETAIKAKVLAGPGAILSNCQRNCLRPCGKLLWLAGDSAAVPSQIYVSSEGSLFGVAHRKLGRLRAMLFELDGALDRAHVLAWCRFPERCRLGLASIPALTSLRAAWNILVDHLAMNQAAGQH